jgi:hypothetical protein
MATNGFLSSKMAQHYRGQLGDHLGLQVKKTRLKMSSSGSDIKSYCKKYERNMRAKKPLKVFVQYEK